MSTHKRTIVEFYRRLALRVDMPTRPSSVRGMAWRSALPRTYHALVVLPYAGDFDGRCFDPPRPIPRIHLNDLQSMEVSARQKQIWSGLRSRTVWQLSRQHLELTVTMDELLDFAAWIAAWARAIDVADSSLVLPLPHALEIYSEPLTLSHTYLWTQAAADEHNAYCQRQAERQARRETARAAQRAALCSDGIAPASATEV